MGTLYQVDSTTGTVQTPTVEGITGSLIVQPAPSSGEGVIIKDDTGATLITAQAGTAFIPTLLSQIDTIQNGAAFSPYVSLTLTSNSVIGNGTPRYGPSFLVTTANIVSAGAGGRIVGGDITLTTGEDTGFGAGNELGGNITLTSFTPTKGGNLTLTGTGSANGTITAGGNMAIDGTTLNVDSGNHRVGVGTASPSFLLDVAGNERITGSLAVDSITGNTGGGGIDVLNRTLASSVGGVSIDWQNRFMRDNTGSGTATSLNWSTRVLFSATGATRVNWGSGFLRDAGSNIAVDWTNRLLKTNDTDSSLDWINRTLIDSSAVTTMDWATPGLLSLPNAGAITLTTQNGTNPVGGTITLTAGNDSGGNSTSTGGSILLTSGTASGAAPNTNQGGSITLTANPTVNSSGRFSIGGSITLKSGDNSNGNNLNTYTGGNVRLTTGDSPTGNSNTLNGGSLTLTTGDKAGSGASTGGSILLTSGDPGTGTSVGGSITLTAFSAANGGNLFLAGSGTGHGQIGIGTITPNASASLDITSTTRGLLFPRMTTTQRDLISSPAAGLEIYNTTNTRPEFYNGTAWASAAGNNSSGVTGSVQFSDGANGFSSDATNLFWDDTNNRLGIRTNVPAYALEVYDNSTSTNPLINIQQDNSTGHSKIQFTNSGNIGWIGWESSGQCAFTVGTSQVRIFPSGNMRIDANNLIINSLQGGGTGSTHFGAFGAATADTYSLTGWTGLQVQSAGVLYKPATTPTLSGATNVKVVTNSTTNILQASQNNLAYAPVMITRLVTVTATTYTALSTDSTVLGDATSNNIAVTLPSVSSNIFKILTFKKIDATANTVTITPASGNIDGAASVVLSAQYQSVTIQSDGTNWWII